ncbi:MAG: bacillithiol biosynthesis deacetylase BshB1 [Flavobacteriales bacterium]|jgi:bacillithiol biosynthesis deacetylase BshB1|nr:bacillithiol biosynthesis deacetylase BshB1 [Flavobacteriales bacterium]|tara:strand:+ start:215 stop:934 length:720 start_codon:yes stop_codon:yes gene_type:complete
MSKVDILAVGAHPDDVELGCGGTLLLQRSLGYSIGVIDLTEGELGTRGSAKIRIEESKIAAKKMGLSFRANLSFQDGFFENNRINKLELIKRIRMCQPSIVLANTLYDRHPDHGRAADLIYEACFLAGLEKIETEFDGQLQNPFRPKVIYNYIQYNNQQPDFLIDISDFMMKKMELIKSYSSQFYNPNSKESETIISKKNFLDLVMSRSSDLGRFISVDYAEGFCVNRYLGTKDLYNLI